MPSGKEKERHSKVSKDGIDSWHPNCQMLQLEEWNKNTSESSTTRLLVKLLLSYQSTYFVQKIY